LTRALKPAVASGLGFEWVNRQVSGLTRGAAALLQHTQTGQLNWNVAGILAGLVIILLILVRGL
jgi:NADH-quinone oxidoreductase subunit L